MKKPTVFSVIYALATAPLWGDLHVTSSDQPGGYVPLLESASPDLTPIENARTVEDVHFAMTAISARTHKADVHRSGSSRTTPFTLLPRNVSNTPPQMSTLDSSVAFIQNQRFTFADGSKGLPATFHVPAGTSVNNTAISEGVGLYDSGLAIIALIQSGRLDEAKALLDIYVSGKYGNMELRAIPSRDNGGAFSPFDADAHYYFDFTRHNGKWGPEWQLWDAHTGPNAWLALAASQYVAAAAKTGASGGQLQPYVNMASKIGNAMIRLQDSGAQGGVRYGPNSVGNAFNEINTENNVSAYAALQAIASVTGQTKYREAAGRIRDWMQNAPVFNPLTGQTQQGLRDHASGLLNTGVSYSAANNRWELQTKNDYQGNSAVLQAADSGGTWAISALGAESIDGMWGAGAAYKMWSSVREQMGRTATQNGDGSWSMTHSGSTGRLDGLDYNRLYAANQSLISPEWTGGGMFATRQLADYYSSGKGQGVISESEVSALSADYDSMKGFISQTPNPYALGPGLTGPRQGETGFGLQAPPASVSAMASIYPTLVADPLASPRL